MAARLVKRSRNILAEMSTDLEPPWSRSDNAGCSSPEIDASQRVGLTTAQRLDLGTGVLRAEREVLVKAATFFEQLLSVVAS